MINLDKACQLWCKDCNARTVGDPLDVRSALLLLNAHNEIKEIMSTHAFNHSVSINLNKDLSEFIANHGGHLTACIGLNGKQYNHAGGSGLMSSRNGLYLIVRSGIDKDKPMKIQTIIEDKILEVDEYETLSVFNGGLIRDFIILEVINDGYLVEVKGKNYQWLKK